MENFYRFFSLIFKCCCFLLLCLLLACSSEKLNIATYNIRLNIASDNINAWPNRKEWVKELILHHQFDVFGVQEALHDQMMDLDDLPNFEYVGVGRDDGKEKGEYSAIFYNVKRFKLNKSGTFWLSQTPDQPSKGWDAANVRICTWALFTELKARREFYVFNTHFDHVGVLARENSVKLILEKMKELSPANIPVIVMGDLNSTPGTSAYLTMSTMLADSHKISKAKPDGPWGTFNGFDFNSDLKDRIDYIFVNDKVKVLTYVVLKDAKESHYPSDHLPVVCRISLK